MENTTLAVIAIIAALAVLGVVAITLVTIPLQLQQAEALAGIPGCGNGTQPFFASKGHCFHMFP